MIQYLLLGFLATAACSKAHSHRIDDPFASLDRQISHSLAFHYLWPWNQLIKVAAALDAEEHLEEPQVLSDAKKFQINLNVKRFMPEELRIKVKNRYVIVEGKHKTNDATRIMANHFVQRFVLPPGSKGEEVVAVLNANGVLSISAPKHDVPPPPPDREVPIVVLLPNKSTEKPATEKPVTETPVSEIRAEKEKSTEKTEAPTSTPIEQIELTEATTHIGKTRKKELKTTPNSSKNNEVDKEGNGLDYAQLEADE
jgi:hypothetical protein